MGDAVNNEEYAVASPLEVDPWSITADEIGDQEGWGVPPPSFSKVPPRALSAASQPIVSSPPPSRKFRTPSSQKPAPSAWGGKASELKAIKAPQLSRQMPTEEMLKQDIGTATKGMKKLRALEAKQRAIANGGASGQQGKKKSSKQDLRNLAFGR